MCPEMSAAAKVRVLRGKDVRVLYCQGTPGWNYKFIRLALQSEPGIKLAGLTRTSAGSFFRQDIESPGELADGFPSTLEEIAAFDVVVLSDFKPADLTSNQQELLKRFCGEFGGGVLIIGGTETFDSSWKNSRLEQLLPIRFAVVPPVQEPVRSLSGGRSQPRTGPYADSQSARQSARPFGLQLTNAALDHPVFQISDTGTQHAAWGVLPKFAQYARVGSGKLGAQIWAVNPDDIGPDGRPRILIAQQRYGAGTSAVICIGDLWQWRLSKNSDPQHFDRFWQQLFRYFSDASGEEVAIHFPDQELRPKSEIRAIVERCSDPQNPKAAQSYEVRIEDAQKKRIMEATIELAPSRSIEVRFQVETPGTYTVQVLEPNHTPQASRTVEIREVNMEFQDAARDMENLRQWASLTGGIAVKVEDCDDAGQLIEQIKAQAERPSRGRHSRMPVGMNHWILIALLACLCGEWALRKRWRLP